MKKQIYIGFALAVLLSGCGGDGSQPAADQPTAQAEAAPVALKQIGKAEGIDFTVTDVATPNQIGPAGLGPKAETGETFVVVSYTIKNTADEALALMERPGLSLIDGSGRSYAPDDLATPMAAGMMDDATGMAADLNPNVSAKTKAAWKVDKAAFDRGTWRLVVATDPTLTFALK